MNINYKNYNYENIETNQTNENKECSYDTIEDCNNAPIRPFSRFVISKWKTQESNLAIISTNSRPLPQPRNGRIKNRALPQINEFNTNCWNNSDSCDLYSTNGGLIDPTTGLFISPGDNNRINHNDYLLYNNPNIKINFDGQIACNNEDGIIQQNFYSGPGWKSSRVHPNKKTALSRPIKHWRKQLLPRQFVDPETGNIADNINYSNYEVNGSNPRRGRSSISKDLFSRPGSYSNTSIDTLKNFNEPFSINSNNQVSCIPIYVTEGLNQNNKSCLTLNNNSNTKFNLTCPQSQALNKSRVGYSFLQGNVTPWNFQSANGYLQARVKLYDQNYTFSYNPYMSTLPINLTDNKLRKRILTTPNFPPSTISLYILKKLINYVGNNRDTLVSSTEIPSSCWVSDCKCAVPVSYKPSNIPFQRDSAVNARSNTRRKTRKAINRNQYNITNSWGINSRQDSLYTKCDNYRVTQNGSVKYPPVEPEPEPEPEPEIIYPPWLGPPVQNPAPAP